MGSSGRQTILFALAANAAIAIAKLAGGLIGGSSVLLAQAAHEVRRHGQPGAPARLAQARCQPRRRGPSLRARQGALLLGLRRLRLDLRRRRPALDPGGDPFLVGEHGEVAFKLTLGVLLFSLVAEGIALFRAIRHLRHEAEADGKPFFASSRDGYPTPKVVLFEDSAAVVGVVIALIGVTLAHVTGSHLWDGGAAVAIGVLLVVTGFSSGATRRAS